MRMFKYTPKSGKDDTALGCIIPANGLILSSKIPLHMVDEQRFDIVEVDVEGVTVEPVVPPSTPDPAPVDPLKTKVETKTEESAENKTEDKTEEKSED